MSDNARTHSGATVKQSAEAAYDNLRSAGIPRDEARRIADRAATDAHRTVDNANKGNRR